MFAGWMRLGVLGILVLATVGCLNTDKRLKPPKQPDQYVLPPTADGRYQNYPDYPARVMNDARIKAAMKDDDKEAQPGFTSGAGGGMH